jgi:hypothetical protein
VIALNIGNIRPGSVERGFEYGRGRGVLDRWEGRFVHYVGGAAPKRHTKAIILPRMIDPLDEHLLDGLIYKLDHYDPSTFVVTYLRYDA